MASKQYFNKHKRIGKHLHTHSDANVQEPVAIFSTSVNTEPAPASWVIDDSYEIYKLRGTTV